MSVRKKQHEHKIVFDEISQENVCTTCGEIVNKEKVEYKLASNPRAPKLNGSGTTSSPLLEETKRSSGVIIPVTQLNADYTLTGSLASQMGEINRDAHGNKIANPLDTNRLRFVDKYYVNAQYNADKSLRNAMWIIAMLSDKLSVSELIKERAAEIYRKAYKKNAVRGRSTRWLACAALYYACRQHKIFRNPNDYVFALEPDLIKEKDRSGRKDLFASYKILTDVLQLPLPELTSPVSELGRIATIAGISEKSIRKATELYKKLREYDKTIFYGKSPAAISVCILYIATKYTDEHVKQDIITHSGQISTVTLRKRCDEYIGILKKIDPELPEEVYANRNNLVIDRDEFDDLDSTVPDYVPTEMKEDTFNQIENIDSTVQTFKV